MVIKCMENKKLKFSIVIPTYRHLQDFLIPCIESIKKYTDMTDGECLIVANGCGNDGTKEYVELLGEHFKLIWVDEGIGFTKATNLGVKESKGDIIILMNNDVVLLEQPKNQWLNFLCNPLKDNIGITCNLKIWDESVERMFAVGFLMAFPRFIWDRIGGFDESWSPGGGEDIEFCLQVEQLGFKIIQVPDENNQVINGINVNCFMSYHKGEGTAMDNEHKEMWIKHIADVRKRLEYKYKLPPGWFYGQDIEEYRRLVEDIPTNGVLFELGCYKGRSLCSVSDIIKRKKLHVNVVDIFTGTKSEGQFEPDYLEEFLMNITRFGIRENVTVYKCTTDEAVRIFENKYLYCDLLFIDADHQYEAIKNDINQWESRVIPGGTISGHDYGTHPGISKAVNEKWSNIRVAGYIWSKRL